MRIVKVMALKTEKGRSIGKDARLRSLAKRWVLAVEDASTKKGTLATIWESPFLAEARYRKHEQEIDTFQSCVPWGIMCGRHCSEASAAAALERGEIEEVRNTTGRGPALLYRTVDVQCTRDFVRLAPVAIPLARVFGVASTCLGLARVLSLRVPPRSGQDARSKGRAQVQVQVQVRVQVCVQVQVQCKYECKYV